jgi:CDGSH-type Zn-finger protein
MNTGEIVQKQPIVTEVNPGTYAWCACGLSSNQPFCDGSHQQSDKGLTPAITKIEEPKKVAWCACKQSGNAPFCDGTHAKL